MAIHRHLLQLPVSIFSIHEFSSINGSKFMPIEHVHIIQYIRENWFRPGSK